jgi:epoxyqueuosine reductase
MDLRREELRRRLSALGFDDVRFAALAPAPDGRGLKAWLDAGRQGEMHWMERTAAKRLDPGLVLPGARSIILLGVNYWKDGPAQGASAPPSPGRPIWARYALYSDYHDSVRAALVRAGAEIEAVCEADADAYRYYVDTGPVLERAWAARAGLGFVGKNAMLISRRHGNWLFLAAILTRAEFAPDPPVRVRAAVPDAVGLLCGKCTRCLDACPTQAFDAPGVLDARRCVSYQTIENKGAIPRALRGRIGLRIYGCDTCLEVCPWNRFARRGRQLLLAARDEVAELSLDALLRLTPTDFAARFRGTAIKRIKRVGLLRNACVAAGNSGDARLVPPLLELAVAAEPLVRAHAVWAVYRLGHGARLASARAAESDPAVLAEYAAEDAKTGG